MRSEGFQVGCRILPEIKMLKGKQDKIMQQTLQIKREIDSLWTRSGLGEAESTQKAIVYILRLNNMKITWDILEKTGIGYTIDNLRRDCMNVAVKERGKRLLRKWKELDPNTHQTKKAEKEEEVAEKALISNDGATGDARKPATSSKCEDLNLTVPVFRNADEELLWTVRCPPGSRVGLKLIFQRIRSNQNMLMCSNGK